jgi:flagellar basal-body rod modification protein FlgD
MDIENIGNFSAPPASSIGSRSETLDRMDFLQMLVAQMRSQDPMNPLQAHEYAAQLAQFSSVQELQSINTSMANLFDANLLMTQSINNNMAAALVGKMVRADMNEIEVGSAGNSNLQFQLDGAATDIKLEIRDANGELVRTITVPPHGEGDASATWDGLDENGVRVPPGTYNFAVKALDASGNAVAATTFIEGEISAVNYENGSATLIVDGVSVSMGQVISIFASDDSKRG